MFVGNSLFQELTTIDPVLEAIRERLKRSHTRYYLSFEAETPIVSASSVTSSIPRAAAREDPQSVVRPSAPTSCQIPSSQSRQPHRRRRAECTGS